MVIDLDKLDLRYRGDVVLTGNGGVSQDLIPRVAEILETTFKFHGLTALRTGLFDSSTPRESWPYENLIINHDVGNIKPHLDGEVRQRMSREMIRRYHGKSVYIVQNNRVYDNRLELIVRQMAKAVDAGRVTDPELTAQIAKLSEYCLPDMRNSVAPRNASTRFNPSAQVFQLLGQIRAVRQGEPRHIGVAMPMTLYEWAHNFLKKWTDKGVYEMPSFHLLLEYIRGRKGGADSMIVLHPHAPKEGLEVSGNIGLNYVMIYPSTFTLSSNGWIYNVDKFFRTMGIDLSADEFDPIREKIEADVCSLGSLKEYKHLLIYASSVDEGSRQNAEWAANRFGLRYIKSFKERKDEGQSTVTNSDNLEDHLNELMKITTDAEIKVIIFDDLANSGSTANDAAKLRKEQVAKFNEQKGTNYKVKVELIVTHFRYPEVSAYRHQYVNRIYAFDTVPYLPPLQEQLAAAGIQEKFCILNRTPHQLALGIALDYYTQMIHYLTERHLESTEGGSFREATDRDLVRKCGFGQDLKNLRRLLEGE